MQEDPKQQDVAAPVMDVADQLPEKNVVLEIEDGFIGPGRRRFVNKFKQDPGAEEQENQHCCHAAQPPGKGKTQGTIVHRPGPEMQEQAVQKFICSSAFPVGLREAREY